VCGVDGEYGTAESLIAARALFLPSLAVFVGVDGAPEVVLMVLSGVAVGRALKNRCENLLEVSSTVTTTAAAPAVYANVRDDERQSKAVGEDTVVPMILLSDKPDS
jgi:hypothetical protein